MLSLAHYPTTPLLAIAGIVLDTLLGEPRRWHPLVGFGRYANRVETWLYSDTRQHGITAWMLAVLPPVLLTAWLDHVLSTPLSWLFDTVVLYFALGARSLTQHAEAVRLPLSRGDLAAAREQAGRIVSRDTRELDATGVARAAVESILENGADAIFGALFWFLLLGAPGAILYRLANTLDAMWGYRNERFLHFGWAAARIDDMLNLIPARLTAIGYSLCGNMKNALQCWITQAATWYSPNAGPVMAAGAGALQLTLGGSAIYHGIAKQRPQLGCGPTPQAGDIERACRLVHRAMLLWLAIILAGGLLHA